MPVRPASLLVLAAGLALAAPAAASWPPGGKFVSSPNNINGVRNARILESASKDLFVLGVGNGGSYNTFCLQRVSRAGEIAPGWPAAGVPFSTVIKGAPLYSQSFIVDDSMRTWHSWSFGGSASLQSVAADAGVAPAPEGTAYSLNIVADISCHAVPAPGGDLFVVGGERLTRLSATGAPSSGWSSTGVRLPGWWDNAILPDGSGGVVVLLRYGPSGAIATRVDGNGVMHNGWPGGGLVLSGTGMIPDNSRGMQLLPAGPDHAIAVWSRDAGSGMQRLLMQRFGLDGTLDPAWPADGIEVVAPDTLIACRAIADGAGGAYVVRQSHGHPLATHVTATGSKIASDVEFIDADAGYVPTCVSGSGFPFPDDMIADVTPDGGLLVGWNDTRLAPAVSFRLRWLTASLTPAPGKPASGLVFVPASPRPIVGSMLALLPDGADAAFIAWRDDINESINHGYGDVWMTRVQAPELVGEGSLAARALSLSAPRPNPARGSVALDVSLPDDSPARVELLDIAGRVVRTQVVQGAGAQAVSFADLTTLEPGLYFARVTGRAGSRSTRIAVSR